jgi:hypothetical protein
LILHVLLRAAAAQSMNIVLATVAQHQDVMLVLLFFSICDCRVFDILQRALLHSLIDFNEETLF